MASRRNVLRERKANLVSNLIVTQAAVLALVVISICILSLVDRTDGHEQGLHESRRNVNERVVILPGLRSRRGRNLLETSSNERPLAVKADRYDPFNDFRKYKGGYDVESKHYWGSLVWTGLPGYVLAAGWLFLGLLGLLLMCCTCCCCRRKGSSLTHPKNPPGGKLMWFTILTAALLTMASIAGCILVFVGSSDFSKQARRIEHTIQGVGTNVTGTLNSLGGAIVDVENLVEPFNSSSILGGGGIDLGTLNSTRGTLSRESRNINHTIHKNMHILSLVITYLEVILMVVAGLCLITIILGPVLVLFNWKTCLYLIVFLAWILAAVTAVFLGITIVLDNLVADTCDAMNEYRTDPYNTTLDALLPCQDLMSATGSLAEIASSVRSSITQVNNTLTEELQPVVNNSLKPLCDPLGPPPLYQLLTCPNNTTPIQDLAQELAPFACATNDTLTCALQGKFLTAFQYSAVVAYASAAQTLLNVYPSIGELTNCTIVVQTFDELLQDNCGPTKSAGQLLWDGYLCLAVSYTLLVLWWLFLAWCTRERRQARAVIFPAGSPSHEENLKSHK